MPQSYNKFFYYARKSALKIEGGSLFAHRAGGTTYAAHSLELKVKLKLAIVERGKILY